MTEESMALVELVEKHGDGDFLRELGQWTLQRLMELEAQACCGAGRHERSADRVNRRNGHRDRGLETRLGRLELRIAKLRTGELFSVVSGADEGPSIGLRRRSYSMGSTTVLGSIWGWLITTAKGTSRPPRANSSRHWN